MLSAVGELDMKLFQGLLLAAALAGVVQMAGARAADLPARQAAPIEYVRICDAYGAGFFYIPGTDTCLRVGGLALTELILPQRMSPVSVMRKWHALAAPLHAEARRALKK